MLLRSFILCGLVLFLFGSSFARTPAEEARHEARHARWCTQPRFGSTARSFDRRVAAGCFKLQPTTNGSGATAKTHR